MGGKKKSTDIILEDSSLKNKANKKERPVYCTSPILLEINYLTNWLIFGVEIGLWFDECTLSCNDQVGYKGT